MPEVPPPSPAQTHWRRSRRMILGLLLVWVLVSFVVPYFARELDQHLLGWPLSFWLVAQGGLLVYLAVVLIYDWRMRRLDAELLEAERRRR